MGTALTATLRRNQVHVMNLSHNSLYSFGLKHSMARAAMNEISKFQPDTFIHLAWRVDATKWKESSSQAPLIESTEKLLKFLVDVGVEQTIGIGSCLEYYPSQFPIKEDYLENRETRYTTDKLEMKLIFEELSKSHGYVTTWSRFFFLYGPKDRPERLIPSAVRKIRAHEDIVLTNPNSILDYLHVSDAAEALLLLAKSRSNGVFNIGSGNIITPARVLEEMISISKSKSKVIKISANESLKGYIADIDKITTIGWKPKISLKSGLSEILNIL